MKRRMAAIIGAAVVLSSIFAPAAAGNTNSIDTCVTVYEDDYAQGDHWSVCSTSPGQIQIPDLYLHSEYLTGGGCNSTFNPVPNWANCISSVAYGNLPANYKIQWYNERYYESNHLVMCLDDDGGIGFYNLNILQNDAFRSFRVVAGNC